jgi:hypothetical protein
MFYLYVRKRHVSENLYQTQTVPCCEAILLHATKYIELQGLTVMRSSEYRAV